MFDTILFDFTYFDNTTKASVVLNASSIRHFITSPLEVTVVLKRPISAAIFLQHPIDVMVLI